MFFLNFAVRLVAHELFSKTHIRSSKLNLALFHPPRGAE